MKKWTALILAVALVCLSPLALAQEWYLSTAEKLADRLALLAGNQTYLAFFMDVKQDGVEEELSAMAELSGEKPKAATLLRYAPQKVESYIENHFVADREDADVTAVKEELLRRMNLNLPAMLNHHVGGWLWQALSIHLQTTETCAAPENFEDCALVLDYGLETAVLVTFTRTGEDTVTAQASYIRADSIADETVEPFLALLWEKE